MTRRDTCRLALILLAFAMRMIVPAGYMFDPAAASGTTIGWCSGASASLAQLSPDTPRHDPDHAAHVHGICAYAAATAAAIGPELVTVQWGRQAAEAGIRTAAAATAFVPRMAFRAFRSGHLSAPEIACPCPFEADAPARCATKALP